MDNENRNRLYDEFSCIGGQCSFTCCKGWEISVDPETYKQWKGEFKDQDHVKHTISRKKSSKETKYNIAMGQDKCCPYFNEDGLCRVVLQSGEDYLPSICRQFPRVINDCFGGTEYTLSCACPEVVDILWRKGEQLQLYSREDTEEKKDGRDKEPQLRDILLRLLGSSQFSLMDRLLLGLILLSEGAKDDIHMEEAEARYQDEQYLSSLLRLWREEAPEPVDAVMEQNDLFLDITENYRKEVHYRSSLEPLAAYAEEFDVRDLLQGSGEFEYTFSAYDRLLEQCILMKVFSECIGDMTEDMLLAYQMILLEYVMLRHSVHLLQLMQGSFVYEDIRNYIVLYSRMIGNNPDGMREFFEESFEEGIWEPWYFLLLLNQR